MVIESSHVGVSFKTTTWDRSCDWGFFDDLRPPQNRHLLLAPMKFGAENFWKRRNNKPASDWLPPRKPWKWGLSNFVIYSSRGPCSGSKLVFWECNMESSPKEKIMKVPQLRITTGTHEDRQRLCHRSNIIHRGKRHRMGVLRSPWWTEACNARWNANVKDLPFAEIYSLGCAKKPVYHEWLWDSTMGESKWRMKMPGLGLRIRWIMNTKNP